MAKTLQQKVVSALSKADLTLSCAESCTGGLIAKRITDVSGASAVFHGGVVSYVNAVKQNVLGVSAPVGRQMASGAARLLGTDLAVSTTGVAGPNPDDRGNAVGTVYVSLSAQGKTWCYLCHFDGNRAQVRRAAAEFALSLVLRYLSGADMAEGALS